MDINSTIDVKIKEELLSMSEEELDKEYDETKKLLDEVGEINA